MSFPHGTVLRSAEDRFFEKIEVDESGCWLWTGGTAGNGGYGYFYRGNVRPEEHGRVYAHRWSYEHHVGPIAPGFVIDHLCRVHRCVNPEHLEAVPQKENVRRGIGNGHQTHCPHGHLYSGDNLYVSPKGSRFCRACRNIKSAALRAKRGA